jgi:hypothetical protein
MVLDAGLKLSIGGVAKITTSGEVMDPNPELR